MSVHEEIRTQRPAGPYGLESVAQRGAAQRNDPELLSAAAAHGKTGTIERVRLGKLPEAYLHLNATLFMVTHVAVEEPDKYLPSSKGYFVRRAHAPRAQAPAGPPPPGVAPPAARSPGRTRTVGITAPPSLSAPPPARPARQRTHVGPAPTRPTPRPVAATPGAPDARRPTGAHRALVEPQRQHTADPAPRASNKRRRVIFFMALGIALLVLLLALAFRSTKNGPTDAAMGAMGVEHEPRSAADPGAGALDASAGAEDLPTEASTASIVFDAAAPIVIGSSVAFEVQGVPDAVMMVMWTFGRDRIQERSLHQTFAFADAGTHSIQAVVVLEGRAPVTVTSSITVVAPEVRIGSDETLTLPTTPGTSAAPTAAVTPLAGDWVSRIGEARLNVDSDSDVILLAGGAISESDGSVDCSAIWGMEATVHPVTGSGLIAIDLSALRAGQTPLCVVGATLEGRTITEASAAEGLAVRVDPAEERLVRRDDGSLGANPDVGQMSRWARAPAADGCPVTPPADGTVTADWPAPARTFDELEEQATRQAICFWGQDALGNWTAPMTFRGRTSSPRPTGGQVCPGTPRWEPSVRGCVDVEIVRGGLNYSRIEFGDRDVLAQHDGVVRVCPTRVGVEPGQRFRFWAHMTGTPFTRCGPWSFRMPGGDRSHREAGGAGAPENSNNGTADDENRGSDSDDGEARRADCLDRCTRDHPSSGIARSNCINRCD